VQRLCISHAHVAVLLFVIRIVYIRDVINQSMFNRTSDSEWLCAETLCGHLCACMVHNVNYIQVIVMYTVSGVQAVGLSLTVSVAFLVVTAEHRHVDTVRQLNGVCDSASV